MGIEHCGVEIRGPHEFLNGSDILPKARIAFVSSISLVIPVWAQPSRPVEFRWLCRIAEVVKEGIQLFAQARFG